MRLRLITLIILTPVLLLITQQQLASTDIKNNIWPPQLVRWKIPGGKELIFVAVHHTTDLKSPIPLVIRDIFTKEKPDLFVMEGFSSEREGISPKRLKVKAKECCENNKGCGENLYAAYLATQADIPFIGAEISEHKQMEPLKQKGFSFEDLVFYMLVQQLPFFFRDGDFETHTKKFTHETWAEMCSTFMQKNIAG